MYLLAWQQPDTGQPSVSQFYTLHTSSRHRDGHQTSEDDLSSAGGRHEYWPERAAAHCLDTELCNTFCAFKWRRFLPGCPWLSLPTLQGVSAGAADCRAPACPPHLTERLQEAAAYDAANMMGLLALQSGSPFLEVQHQQA